MEWIQKLKFDIFNAFFENGLVGVMINPYVPGVIIPERLRDTERILFHIGKDIPIPIPDLVVSKEWGIQATLLFDGCPFKVSFPWLSVYALGLVGGEITCHFPGAIISSVPEVTDDSEDTGKVFPFPSGRLKN